MLLPCRPHAQPCKAWAQASASLASASLAFRLSTSNASACPFPRAHVHAREFYCHSVGHYLGLDVHDTNTVGPHRTLEPGVVLAVEPGLYIPNAPQFGAYAGIGVRIEDDVLVSQSGAQVRRWRWPRARGRPGWRGSLRAWEVLMCARVLVQVLSGGVPVDPDEIEALVGAAADERARGGGASSDAEPAVMTAAGGF